MAYRYRRSITIDHDQVPNSDLSDYPVMVGGIYAYLATRANSGKVENASGYDVIFTSDESGATQLSHEIDIYDPATGTVVFWVKLPSVSCTDDTIFYMWYGNGLISTSQENIADVWSNGYASVYHFGDESTLDLTDSVGNNDLTESGAPLSPAGKIGGAIGTQTNECAYNADPVNLPEGTTAKTIEVWSNRSGFTGTWLVSFGGEFSLVYQAAGKMALYGIYTGGSWKYAYVSNNVYDGLGTWRSTAVTFPEDGNWADILFYVDGESAGSTQLSGVSGAYPGTGHSSLYVGRQNSYNGNYWNGALDEVRISNVDRSSDWLATTYNNESSPDTFYQIGDEVAMFAHDFWPILSRFF